MSVLMISFLITVFLLKDAPRGMVYRLILFIFHNYFFSTEKSVVEHIYESLSNQKQDNGDSVIVYWDKQCLDFGYNWEAGFMQGIMNACVIILLISNKAC